MPTLDTSEEIRSLKKARKISVTTRRASIDADIAAVHVLRAAAGSGSTPSVLLITSCSTTGMEGDSS